MKIKTSTKHHIKTPWHLWAIGVFLFFIYSIGAYDYFMVQINNIDYLNSINAKGNVIAYFMDYPLAFTIFWTINILSGLIAAVLLLFRTKWAIWGGLVAAISKTCLDILTFTFMNRWNVFGPSMSIIDVTILAITIGFLFYCKVLAKRGVLNN